jgi:hypothetical protein
MGSREAGTGTPERSGPPEAERERRRLERTGMERTRGGWRRPPPPPLGIGGEDAVEEVDTTILCCFCSFSLCW